MKRLRTLRLRKFLTQRALGELVGVPYETVNRWENGAQFPRPAQLQRLCTALGVDVDDLVAFEDWPQKIAA